jgi:hypothetical protein
MHAKKLFMAISNDEYKSKKTCNENPNFLLKIDCIGCSKHERRIKQNQCSNNVSLRRIFHIKGKQLCKAQEPIQLPALENLNACKDS